MSKLNGEALVNGAVCLHVIFHRPYLLRVGSLAKVETTADKKMLRLNKMLFDSDEYRKMESLAGEFRRWIQTRAVDDRQSILAKGVDLVPIGVLDEVLSKLAEYEAAYMEAAEAFVARYPELVELAKGRLGDQFDGANYPSAGRMRAGCYVTRRVSDFGLPSVEKIGESVWLQEQKKAKELWDTAAAEIRYALREAFVELIRHLAEKLEPTGDRKRVLKDSAVRHVTEFLDLFEKRNLTDDTELAKLVEKARKVLEGKSPGDLRDSDSTRSRVFAGLQKVTGVLDKLVQDAPKRRIDFDD